MAVFVPSNCTDLLQPIDLSVNKPFKDHLRRCFAEWYSQQVSIQLEAGTQVENVKINTRLSVLKEIGAKWLTSAFDYIKSHTDIIVNGFVKAGITDPLPSHISVIESVDSFASDIED